MPTWPGKKAFSAPNSEISICLTSVANELRLINKIPYFGSFTFLKAQALVVHYSPPPALLHRITHSNPSPSGKGQEGKGKDATPECLGFPGGSDFKESACNTGDLGSISGLGRSPGGGHVNPLQCSCLDNSHGQSSLAGYSLWRRKDSDVTVTKHSTQKKEKNGASH